MTESDRLLIEPLARRHDRTVFSSGVAELDQYLARRAGQDTRRRIARVFVCTAGGGDGVLGYYTLSALSVDLASLPDRLSRRLPRHPVPCALIGRLAVDRSRQGQGLGRMLLADAVKRAIAIGDSMAIHAMIVDAENEGAKAFYEKFGFIPLPGNAMRLFLPLGRTGF